MGVLNMPPALWTNDSLDQTQRHNQYQHAAKVIDQQDTQIEELLTQRKELQRLLANYACETGAGANDAAVINALNYGFDDPDE